MQKTTTLAPNMYISTHRQCIVTPRTGGVKSRAPSVELVRITLKCSTTTWVDISLFLFKKNREKKEIP